MVFGWLRTYSERMAQKSLDQKLAILSDAAKYDASCASSGSTKRDSRDGKGLGSNGPCCTDRACADIEAVCSFPDAVNAAQV